jgi:hypothetical protein
MSGVPRAVVALALLSPLGVALAGVYKLFAPKGRTT